MIPERFPSAERDPQETFRREEGRLITSLLPVKRSPVPSRRWKRTGGVSQAAGFWNLSFRGQGALASFSGKDAAVSLEGAATTALPGAEWRAKRWRAGAPLSHSWGNGGYIVIPKSMPGIPTSS